ncbi:OmpA family protein [Agaribacterium haliotis]|uniref:OmpA family protein n=1 Tax=Agaribacterium haliotis TaxID=2013869 RepID=UPI0011773766|nr:OmpA family protein [Agaribacterium haliotis]
MKALFIKSTRLAVASAISLSVCACSSWPKHGSGGQAELDGSSMISVGQQQALTAAHGLRFDYEISKNRLDILLDQGAAYCLPASIKQAQLQEYRIARELASGLFDDAETSIVKQRIGLNKIEFQLNRILASEQCQPPIAGNTAALTANNTSSGANAIKELQRLLNSDNQFVSASAKLNPKYQHNLEIAAKILIEQPGLLVKLIGHTDRHGADVNNLSLSAERAEAVKEQLVSTGVQADRIHSFAAGETSPPHHGEGAAVDLVNRSVSAFVIAP